MNVPVERQVEQVKDGTHYKGYVTIGETTLGYEIVFGVPIPRLACATPPTSIEGVRELAQITITRDGVNVDLTDAEYTLFFDLLVEFTISFYGSPQAKEMRGELLGALSQGDDPLMAAMGVSIKCSMVDRGMYQCDSLVWEMLAGPKFGCTLPP